MKAKILYIEDELPMARIVSETLSSKGYEVMHREDGGRILDVISSFDPDLCLLDVMLPAIDGFSLGSMIHNLYPALPVIFITAKSQTQDVVSGFSSGGTDYIRKPFSIEELIARIDNQIRISQYRQSIATESASDVQLGMLTYVPSRLELHNRTEVIKLSNREAEILNVLCMHQNQVIDRRKLLQLVWGDDSFFHSRNLDVYVRKLREYFGIDCGVELITLKGKGYHFSVRN